MPKLSINFEEIHSNAQGNIEEQNKILDTSIIIINYRIIITIIIKAYYNCNVKLITSKNLDAKSTMFPHRKIHKYTWTSPDGQTRNQIDHILIDRRWHSSILDVRSFRGADCDTDHYLVVANLWKVWQ